MKGTVEAFAQLKGAIDTRAQDTKSNAGMLEQILANLGVTQPSNA